MHGRATTLLITTAIVLAGTPLISATDGGDPPWPPLADAQIRPGVHVVSDGTYCTSNFVFRDLHTGRLYLGLAAHCVEATGRPADIGGVNGGVASTGVVAYVSWEHGTSNYHDFALVRIPDEDAGTVHPAMLHFGGPTGVADASLVEIGDKVVTYGRSPLRLGLEATNAREGYVVKPGEEGTNAYIVTPGLPGDSGSAILDGGGRALGVLTKIQYAPLAASNVVTHLDLVLPHARAVTGLALELQTWELLTPGLLPDPERLPLPMAGTGEDARNTRHG